MTSGGKQNGCIISKGTWYTTGTCATFTATSDGQYDRYSHDGTALIISKDPASPLHQVKANALFRITS